MSLRIDYHVLDRGGIEETIDLDIFETGSDIDFFIEDWMLLKINLTISEKEIMLWHHMCYFLHNLKNA